MFYHLGCDQSDDPQWEPGEVVSLCDAQTGQFIHGVVSYDTATHELTRAVENHGSKWEFREVRQCRVRFRERIECVTCHGNGQYVGLTLVEHCATCGGSGWVHP